MATATLVTVLPPHMPVLPHWQNSFKVRQLNSIGRCGVARIQLPPPPDMWAESKHSMYDYNNNGGGNSSFKTVRIAPSVSFSQSFGSFSGSAPISPRRSGGASSRLACTYELRLLTATVHWIGARHACCVPPLALILFPCALLADLLWGALLCRHCRCDCRLFLAPTSKRVTVKNDMSRTSSGGSRACSAHAVPAS